MSEIVCRITADEEHAIKLLAEAWNAMVACGAADQEAAAHVHALQYAVMAQPARRSRPDLFRQSYSGERL